jgi:hypothetical protein
VLQDADADVWTVPTCGRLHMLYRLAHLLGLPRTSLAMLSSIELCLLV